MGSGSGGCRRRPPPCGRRSAIRVPAPGSLRTSTRPPRRVHVFAYLVGADPHALAALGRVERSEQPVADEFADPCRTASSSTAKLVGPARRRRSTLTDDRCRRRRRRPARCGSRARPSSSAVPDRPRPRSSSPSMRVCGTRPPDARALARLARDVRERDVAVQALDLATLQLLDQPLHAARGIGDRADRVVDELRVAAVLLGIRDDQRELRRQVLEIVHHERGQTVVGLELPALGQPLGRPRAAPGASPRAARPS